MAEKENQHSAIEFVLIKKTEIIRKKIKVPSSYKFQFTISEKKAGLASRHSLLYIDYLLFFFHPFKLAPSFNYMFLTMVG